MFYFIRMKKKTFILAATDFLTKKQIKKAQNVRWNIF